MVSSEEAQYEQQTILGMTRYNLSVFDASDSPHVPAVCSLCTLKIAEETVY